MAPSRESFTDRAYNAIEKAADEAEEHGHPQVVPAHLAYVLINGDDEEGQDTVPLFKQAIEKAGGDGDSVIRFLKKTIVRLPAQFPAVSQVAVSSALTEIMAAAYKLSKKQKDSYVAIYHLISALVQDRTIEQGLKEAGVPDMSKIDQALTELRGSKKIDNKTADSTDGGNEWLKKFTVDMTALAREGKIDPVIGREEEMRRVIRILSRRTKNNPVLVGEPGVGKTTVVEGLARRIVNSDVPTSLAKCKLLSLDIGSLIAGASFQGQFEERIKNVLKEIETSDTTIILFIDEIHMLMGAGASSTGGMDAANLLKPMLARGQLHCIGATTLNEYQKYIEKDSAFERRFQQVLVPEPTVPETISILRGLKERYEVHHGVNILDSAIVSAATLAARYLTSRRLPDSAVDLIDEAAASVRVTRDSQPEALDLLERRYRQLQIEIHALEREKDKDSMMRLEHAKKEAESVNAELVPLREKYTKEKQRSQEIQEAKIKLDSLKVRLDSATRSGDTSRASDLAYYAIPDVEKRIIAMERAKAKADAEAREKTGGESDSLVVDAVGPDQINEIVGRWTGIPVTRLKTTEKDKLLHMEQQLTKTVIGQKEAVRSVSNAIRLQRSGLSNPNSPPSFLFCGPSGTGKTLLTKALAEFLFDDPNAMIRFDMSEYQERHSLSRMIGAPPGYVGHDAGGQLTDGLRRRPFSILLFDEVEKAAKEVLTVLLQLMDDGRITDGQGRIIDAKNCIVVMTSNLGAEYLSRPTLPDGSIDPTTKQLVMGALRDYFLPEFLNRISSTVIFNRLPKREIRKIVDVRLAEIQKRLDDNGRRVKIECAPEVKDYLGKAGYSPAYGARPLARLIEKELLNNLAVFILRGSIKDGEVARVVMHNGRITIVPNHEDDADAMETSSDEENYDTEEEMDEDEDDKLYD
ncbi:hsp98-like protein [Arthroderma uncinatum]|uniref:hsp98-like protein n=1 Tax=Arthroderma uncinatum TaxID=74035 RepID=UPI00144AD7FF|nr:hsp98-like protein [Arthroderma uncinatum]KAF3481236.1 hsp98-like protein [Arthroderma uncinatum]